MIRALRTLALVMALVVVPRIVLAQGNVRVTLLRPPPNQLRVADLWKVDLDNQTDRTWTVYLRGFVDEATDGRIVDARSNQFRLQPRQRVRLTGSMLEPIDVDEWNEDYKEVVFRSGQVPTGEYRVCVEVYAADTDSLLGTDCYDQPIEQLSPPILVFPPDESTVTERLPSFTWLQPSPARQGDRLTYQIRVVEVLGRQTPFDAMESNPAFFELSNLTATTLRFPMGARPFIVGNTYAWMIRAFLPTRSSTRRPIAESEIWSFTYGKLDVAGDPDPDDDSDTDVGQRPPNPTRDETDIVVIDDISPDTGPRIGTRTQVPVTRDLTIKPGIVPPGIDLDKVIVKKPDIMVLNPMLLRALMHQCQGND